MLRITCFQSYALLRRGLVTALTGNRIKPIIASRDDTNGTLNIDIVFNVDTTTHGIKLDRIMPPSLSTVVFLGDLPTDFDDL